MHPCTNAFLCLTYCVHLITFILLCMHVCMYVCIYFVMCVCMCMLVLGKVLASLFWSVSMSLLGDVTCVSPQGDVGVVVGMAVLVMVKRRYLMNFHVLLIIINTICSDY